MAAMKRGKRIDRMEDKREPDCVSALRELRVVAFRMKHTIFQKVPAPRTTGSNTQVKLCSFYGLGRREEGVTPDKMLDCNALP